MSETAVIKLEQDGHYYFNDAASALLLGISVDTLRALANDAGCREPSELPESVIKNGRRRAKEFGAATGTEQPDIGEVLIHFARREGAELVYEDADGERFTLTSATGQDGGAAPHSGD
ncbi:hypothetical protein RD149_16195 [Gordonia westfalica]|uniref:Uncharacterized protein n=1 Tax=Gordonia westfalica TaxID=158898 RepID=A0ABU2GWA4_9ACTN|nr:hypothetical protein [Gordonia westfalica]MDS1115300.1 hypothetical protein [Gordonia westfalica]